MIGFLKLTFSISFERKLVICDMLAYFNNDNVLIYLMTLKIFWITQGMLASNWEKLC